MSAAPGELRWRQRRSSFRVPGEVFRPVGYDVADLADPDAKSFVERHHYSGRYVAAASASACSAGASWPAWPSSATRVTTPC